MNKVNEMKKPIYLVDSAHGIYQGQIFAEWLLLNFPEQYEASPYKEDLDVLRAGPEAEDYIDAAADVLDNIFVKIDGRWYYTYQNVDLWLVPEDYDDDAFFEC